MNDGIPCVQLDEIKIPSIQLPGGAELKGVADFASGIPTNCQINLNLLVQLGPLLASMGCIFKILELLSSVVEFATAAPNVVKMGEKAVALPGLFAQVAKCLPPLAPIDFALMIKGILQLIINILSCLVDSLASIVDFKVSLDFSSAEGNPALTSALECAQRNADTSMQNLFSSMGPIMTVMTVVGSVASLAGSPITLPDLSQVGKAGDAVHAIESLKQAVDALKSVIESLPG